MKLLSLLMLCCEKQCNIQARGRWIHQFDFMGRYFAKEGVNK